MVKKLEMWVKDVEYYITHSLGCFSFVLSYDTLILIELLFQKNLIRFIEKL